MSTTSTTDDVAATITIGDKTVSRMAFGAMRLADPQIWGEPADREHSVRLARRAVELGVSHIDTADTYGLGTVEDILREALHPYPDHLLIGTKIGQVQPRPGEWVPIGHPAFLRHQCEMSLRRLRVDRIELLYLHRVDPAVPFADQVGTLAELQQEGKIGHIGLSEVSVAQIVEALVMTPVAAVQNIYNLTNRQWDEVVNFCTRERIPFMPWFPVMNGALAQPDRVVGEIATETRSTPTQIALAWLLARSDVMCPISRHVLPCPPRGERRRRVAAPDRGTGRQAQCGRPSRAGVRAARSHPTLSARANHPRCRRHRCARPPRR